MAGFTTRLGLKKPGGGSTGAITPDEIVDIDDINGNFDLLDGAIGAQLVTSTTRPSSPYDGQLIRETDTKNLMHWNASASRWVPIGIPNAGSDTERAALFPTAVSGNRVYRTDKGYEQEYTGSVWVGAGGLVRIKPSSVQSATVQSDNTADFSAVTAFTLNGVFSSDFDNYRILFKATATAFNAQVFLRLTAGGTADASANYNYAGSSSLGTAAPTGWGGVAASGFDIWRTYTDAAGSKGSAIVDLLGPSQAKPTNAQWQAYGVGASNTILAINASGSTVSAGTSDGFQIIVIGGTTMTGTVEVLGYGKG